MTIQQLPTRAGTGMHKRVVRIGDYHAVEVFIGGFVDAGFRPAAD